MLAQRIGEGGVNLRGFSAAAIGGQFVAHLGVDSMADAERVMTILEQA
jgi:hypothetical protein